MQSFLKTYASFEPQQTMAAAVVIPTVLRPHLRQAVESVFAQDFGGRIHILIGIDSLQGDPGLIDAICAQRPSHCTVQVLWPGFSTSVRHGGLTQAGDGGALRLILTQLANSPYVAYLDDDNWWGSRHLHQIRAATAEADWGFALRWFAHPDTRRPICVDTWESVGPGAGMFKDQFGGFVDPSCLMINKLACPVAPTNWNFPMPGYPMTADRNVFAYLSQNHRAKGTGVASVFYMLSTTDGLHEMRKQIMGDAYDRAGEE